MRYSKLYVQLALAMGCMGIQSAYAGGELVHQLPILQSSAQDGSTDQLGVAQSASQGTITRKQLETRPLLRPAEVLETIPGLIVTQHSGEGKANQYFLRGFNLDHGTDFATTVDGVPINMVSHAHGQGYTDLNFLIPELIDSISYHKGATDITDGDFASAGTAKIRTVNSLERPFVQATYGSDDFIRLLAAGSHEIGSGTVLAAIEQTYNNGPWQRPENLDKQNLYLKYSTGNLKNGWSVGLQHYQSQWDATDQIPQRGIDTGLIDRFGTVDPSNGGDTRRTAITFEKNIGDDEQHTQINAFALQSKLNLFSNFTYFLNDPVRGDQFEQAEDRTLLGGRVHHQWHDHWGNKNVINSVGASLRYDDIDGLGLFQTQQRQRFNSIRFDNVQQTSVGVWGQSQIEWAPWLRSIAGVRADYFHFDVASNIDENSGTRNDQIVSPKFSFIFGPWANTEYYVNYAYGFHSNDARGTTTTLNPDPRDAGFLLPVDRVSPLVRTKNTELGVRGEWLPNLTTTIALWQLESDSELLFIGDAGTTEASRPSRRQGIEISQFYKPNEDWIIDVDAAVSRARFRDSAIEGNFIPGAINRTASAGISYNPSGAWNAGLRLRYFGARPLIEDNSVESSSSTLVNLQTAYRFNDQVQAQLEVLNLFDRQVNDIEYFYESCLAQEASQPECDVTAASRDGIADKHVHPTLERTLRFSVRYFF